MLKCSALLGDFFLRSEQVVLQDERTRIQGVAMKSESEASEKILGLFDENVYREEDDIFLPQTFSSEVSARTSDLQFLPQLLIILGQLSQLIDS